MIILSKFKRVLKMLRLKSGKERSSIIIDLVAVFFGGCLTFMNLSARFINLTKQRFDIYVETERKITHNSD